ncbi:MAG: hypothetical protein ABI284_04265 [Nitrosospira sp.]
MNYESIGYAAGIQRQSRKNIGKTPGSDDNSMARKVAVMRLSQVFTQALTYLGHRKLQAMSTGA